MNPQVIQRWKEANDIGPCYEGVAGLVRFEELLKTIGYSDDSYGERAIIAFLESNSGAIEALENWIGEQEVKDWEYELIAATPYDPDHIPDEEEDEENDVDDKPRYQHASMYVEA